VEAPPGGWLKHAGGGAGVGRGSGSVGGSGSGVVDSGSGSGSGGSGGGGGGGCTSVADKATDADKVNAIKEAAEAAAAAAVMEPLGDIAIGVAAGQAFLDFRAGVLTGVEGVARDDAARLCDLSLDSGGGIRADVSVYPLCAATHAMRAAPGRDAHFTVGPAR
jgi:hypothetical protein